VKRYKICPSCGTHNPEHEPLCTACTVEITGVAVSSESERVVVEQAAAAQPAAVKTCPNCKGANNDYAILCDNCGADLSAVESAAPAPAPEPAATPSAVKTPTAEMTTIDKPAPRALVLRSEDGRTELRCVNGTVIGRCDKCQNQMERERAECNRSDRNDMVHCKFNTVSRRHAGIVVENGVFYVVALPESKNATVVNGVELVRGKKSPVNSGDEICFSSKLKLYAELV